jgi:hypothetical protein
VGQTIKAPGEGALKLRALVGSLRLVRFGAGSPLAAASAQALANAARSASSSAANSCNRVCSTGSKKAAVLPEPVWLETIRSMISVGFAQGLLLGSAKGMALSCTDGGLGVAQVGHSLNQFRGQAQQHEAIGLLGVISVSVVSFSIGCINAKVAVSKVVVRRGFAAGDKSSCTSKASVIFFSARDIRKIVRWRRSWLKNINHQTELGAV